MDLSQYSLPELRRLKSRIETEIQRQSVASRRNLLKQIKKMAEEEGLSLNDLMAGAEAETHKPPATTKRVRKTGVKKSKAPAGPLKYRHPENPAIGWSGRGRKPRWVIDWLAQDKPLEALEAKNA